MVKVALTGGAYTAHSVIASAQRCVNLFPEPMPSGNQYIGTTGQGEPSTHAHYPTPGTRLLGTIGTGPIRGIFQCATGHVYVVSGDTLYSVDISNWTGTALGMLTPGIKTPVSMRDNGLDLVVVDGMIAGWTVNLASGAFAAIDTSDGVFSGADRVDYLDTFFILNKPGTPQFYISGSLAVTFDPLDFADKEAYPDLLVTAVVAHRLIYLFGERTSEIWYDAGLVGFSTTDPTVATSFQFAPMQSQVFIDHGCAAKYSPAVYDNKAFWLTKDRQGQGIIMMVEGEAVKRVSTYAIEAEIAGYDRISDAIGFCYQMAGHTFYVLTFPHADKTWSYDIATGLWHQWAWIDSNGDEHRHRANCFWPVNDIGVVGDWQNGNLYALDNRVFTDNGQPIKRVRTFPHMLADGKRVFYRQFLADLETGWAPEMLSGSETRLLAQFTAPDGTNLSSYVSEVGGGWSPLGPANAQIVGNKAVGIGGDALYQSAAAILTLDYTLRYDAVPPVAGSVVSANTIWASGRATGVNTGYRVAVSADGTQYHLTLSVLPSGASASVAMGTIASGFFTVWLLLRGTNITAQVQRSIDRMWLRTDATWHSDPGTIAAQFTDATYALPGVVMVGGTWPTSPPPVGISYTLETPLTPDPNFPTGYAFNQVSGGQTFDWTRNLEYQAILGGGNGGIAVTDLSTMHVTRTTTLNQMYAGTPYGLPAGSPPTQDIMDLTCGGTGTDLYMLTIGDPTYFAPSVYLRFTRVNPTTMKVTGEFYTSRANPPPLTCVTGSFGVVNTTATHTVVAYFTNASFSLGPEIFDGTSMAPIGFGPVPIYGLNFYISALIPGQRHPDGSCDFLLLNADAGGSGHIDIWRIHVTDSLAITNTKTGTVNTLGIIPATGNLFISQADYDTAHNAVILQLTNGALTNGSPLWILSVSFNGTINWQRSFPTYSAAPWSRGQSNLVGNTLMIGATDDMTMLNTGSGATIAPASILVSGSSAGSYYRVWDASRQSYWTFAVARAFVRIDLPFVPVGPMLAMDNLSVTATALQLETNLISLRWSDDRGHSWGSPVTQDIGEAGEYRTSLQWQRLAYARDRVFEISWSVPMRTALQGCWFDATPAQS
jgi:hypothetical protein